MRAHFAAALAGALLLASVASAAPIVVNFNFTDTDFSGSFTYDDSTVQSGPFGGTTQYDVIALSIVHTSLGSWDIGDHVGSDQVITIADSSGQFGLMDEPFNNALFNNGSNTLMTDFALFINPPPPSWSDRTVCVEGTCSEYTTSVAPIPEPGAAGLLGLGLIGLAALSRRRMPR